MNRCPCLGRSGGAGCASAAAEPLAPTRTRIHALFAAIGRGCDGGAMRNGEACLRARAAGFLRLASRRLAQG
jgi:hypothetical protein